MDISSTWLLLCGHAAVDVILPIHKTIRKFFIYLSLGGKVDMLIRREMERVVLEKDISM